MQLSFGDAEDLGGRKRTRREVFLAEMDQVVPWAELVALIEPHYPKLGRPRRQPYALATMLRIYFLQQWYALSDPAMEEALVDTPVMRRFARIGGMEDIPDETTILNFRRLLERHGLAEKLFKQVNAHLQRKGLSLRSGTIPAFARTDATIINAPSSTKNASGTRDPQMHQTRKGKPWYFGMKAHIGLDVDSGLVHSVVGTTANVHDLTPLARLLHGAETQVHADAGHPGTLHRNALQGIDVAWQLAMRPGQRRRTQSAHRGGPSHQCLRTPQGAHARPGRTSLPGHQAAVRLSEGPLSRPGQKHRLRSSPCSPCRTCGGHGDDCWPQGKCARWRGKHRRRRIKTSIPTSIPSGLT